MMKKNIIVIIMLSLLCCYTPPVFAGDGAHVDLHASMQKLPSILDELNTYASSKDYYHTAEKFMELAQVFKSLDSITPAGGDKKQWDMIHNQIIDSAFTGIGGCGSKDDAVIKQAIAKIGALAKKGHAAFK